MPDSDRTKWDAKYAAAAEMPREPSAVFAALARLLPARGRAIDVAGGAGRHGIWLAQRGLEVTIADVSPVGLSVARQRAAEAGVAVQTLCIDLEEEAFPAGPWDLIVQVCYLWRPLLAVYPQVLSAGGTLVVIQPTKSNLQRHDKPPAPYLLEEGELLRLVPSLEVVHYQEGWLADGRHDATLVARKGAGR
jgi:hypothetical protein